MKQLTEQQDLFGQIEGLYSLLQDEESRYIFRQRLLYSLSKDERHIQNMVCRLIENYGEKDSVYCLLRWLKKNAGNKLIIFGAGCACRHLMYILKCYQIEIDCICDNNVQLWGKECYGKLVLSPNQLKELGEEICVIVGTNWYSQEIYKQLCELGIPQRLIFMPKNAWWLGDKIQYFDSQLMIPGENESFIDGGAFTGEDTVEFMKWCGNKCDAVYLFEPDEGNYKKMCSRIERFSIPYKYCYHLGLWNSKTELKFSMGKGSNSCVDEKGVLTIHTAAIDETVKGPVTLIKMDIEGSEMEALKGAKNVIRKYKPRLAICVYHKPEDIIDIPFYIYGLCPDYKFYLRHYSYTSTETVLYAV